MIMTDLTDLLAPHRAVQVITLLFGVGVVVPLIWRTRGWSSRAGLGLALVGSLASAGWAAGWLLTGRPPHTAVVWYSSWLEALPPLQWEVRIDALSSLFVLLIAAFSAVVAIYSFAALEAPHYWPQRHRVVSAFNLFVWATMMTVVVNDVFSLLAMLELMTLAFGYLVLYKHALYLDEGPPDPEKETSARIAPQVYLIVSHTSTALLLVALLLLAIPARSLSLDMLRVGAPQLPPILANVVFLLALGGLGIRAGLTPAHVWVPLVHPSSPTPTHALSLGIAIKVAVYLMMRFFFEFLPPQAWWGYVVLLVAVYTALVNVWYAIASHDLKTALAYHSIENIGIIVAGIGVALIFAAPQPGIDPSLAQTIAALALVASLYHLINHAAFKGLLYLCTGAIDHLTRQVVDFERLGGLLRLYPWTSAAFLVGSAAIAGFPPFNGYVSEWLTLQSALVALGALKGAALRIETIIIIFSLILLVAAFALTAFCFVKIAGMSLLGSPRTSAETRNQEQWSQHDAPWPMRAMMGLMAGLCLALGLLPAFVARLLVSIVAETPGYTIAPPPPSIFGLYLETPVSSIALVVAHPLMTALALTLALLVLVGYVSRYRPTLRPDPWNCGTPYTADGTQYTGAALSFLIRGISADPFRQDEQATPEHLPSRMVLARSKDYPQVVVEYFRRLANSATDGVLRFARWTGMWAQNGDIRQYLWYILIANIVALVLFLVLRGGPA
jgi:hydrogenase-4 component B